MAEIFGVIAGGIGAGSLAIQLIDKAEKLSTVLKSMKDAPNAIHEMLVEIELLTNMLNEIEELHKRETQITVSTTTTRAFKLCQAATSDLRSLIEDLDACYRSISHAYSWKSIRAYMKKDKVKLMGARAKRASNLLMTANQLFFHSSQSRKLDLILDSTKASYDLAFSSANPMKNDTSCISSASPWRSSSSTTSTINWHSITSYCILVGNIHVCYGTSKRRRRPNRETSTTGQDDEAEVVSWKFQFHPASWTVQKGYAINGSMSFGSWQYSVTPYNLRPLDAPIFTACKNRDLASVRELIRDRLASPFDVSPNGETPLHVAAAAAAPDICQLLIKNGADGNYVGIPGGPTPLMCLAEATEPNPNIIWKGIVLGIIMTSSELITTVTPREIHDTVRLLVEEGNCDPMTSSTDALWDHSPQLIAWRGPPETCRWLLEQERFIIDLDTRSKTTGRSMYHQLAFPTCFDRGLELISEVLWTETHISRMVADRDGYGNTILHTLLLSLSFYGFMSDDMQIWNKDAWLKVTQGLLRSGSDVHAQNNNGKTPLRYLLTTWCQWQMICYDVYFPGRSRGHFFDSLFCEKRFSEEQQHSLIRLWLFTVRDTGYDIKEYVREEENLYPSDILTSSYEFQTGAILDWTCRIVYTYGDAQDDVDVSCEFEFEERAGSEPIGMPGSWIQGSA